MHDKEERDFYCVSRIECIVGGYVESSMRASNAFQLVEMDSPKELREKAYDLGKGAASKDEDRVPMQDKSFMNMLEGGTQEANEKLFDQWFKGFDG